MPDWLLAVPLIVGLVGYLAKKGLWRWVGMFAGIAVYEAVLGLTGQTLSQEAWAHFSWDLIWVLGGFWLGLLVHLAWKRLTKKG